MLDLVFITKRGMGKFYSSLAEVMEVDGPELSKLIEELALRGNVGVILVDERLKPYLSKKVYKKVEAMEKPLLAFIPLAYDEEASEKAERRVREMLKSLALGRMD